MKCLLLLGLLLVACQPSRLATGLKQGMSEQQVVEASGNRLPDRIAQRTCGNETAAPFPCRIYVYDGGWRDGRYHSKLSIVFEEVRGRWVVSQWL